jgi:hypothetical protein
VYTKHGEKRGVSERERGYAAEWVASAKVVTTDTALRVTAGVFEVTGASATKRQLGLDRFWRDVRTHTLHDPVAYKNRELGEYVLLDKVCGSCRINPCTTMLMILGTRANLVHVKQQLHWEMGLCSSVCGLQWLVFFFFGFNSRIGSGGVAGFNTRKILAHSLSILT